MPSDRLFGPSLGSDRMRAVVSDAAWVQAMLDVEAALARVQARLGIIPDRAAQEIVPHCQAGEFDVAQIGRDASDSANPVIPLVKALRERVGPDAAPFVHRGVTSQDILDTAMMLIARRGIDVLVDDLRRAASCAAMLAERHRATPMAARTLLQQASVTSFGLKAAGWLVAIVDACETLLVLGRRQLAIQLGGAVGTLAGLQGKGLKVADALAYELELANPVIPWHTDRSRVVKVTGAAAMVAGTAGKIALDVVLLAQTEVGEVHERPVPGRGGSSALPQKQNPVEAIEILAAVRGVNAQAGVVLSSMVQEHERAAGAWQAEWPALSELFLLAGGVTSRLVSMLSSLEVDADRMRRNLDLTKGLVMAEPLATALGGRIDPAQARDLVDAAIGKARENGRPFEEVVREDRDIRRHLETDALRDALDPAHALGESSQLIDRALARHRSMERATDA